MARFDLDAVPGEKLLDAVGGELHTVAVLHLADDEVLIDIRNEKIRFDEVAFDIVVFLKGYAVGAQHKGERKKQEEKRRA